MTVSLTKLGVQQFGKSIQVWIQVGEKRYDIEVRIQACSIAGPQIELQGESSVYLSGGFQGFTYQQPGYSSQPYQPSSQQPYQPSSQPYQPFSQQPYQPSSQPYQPSSQQPYQSSSQQPYQPSSQPYQPSSQLIQPSQAPSYGYPSQAIVETSPTLHWQGKDRGNMNVSIRDNHITIPEGTVGSQLFKVVIHNYSDHKVMISLDPVLAPFSCSYHDIVINP